MKSPPYLKHDATLDRADAIFRLRRGDKICFLTQSLSATVWLWRNWASFPGSIFNAKIIFNLWFGVVLSRREPQWRCNPTQNVKMFSPFIEELKCKDRSLPMKQKAVKSSFLLSFTWWWFLALSLLGNGVLLILSVVRLIQIMVSNDNASVLLPALYCIPALPFWECTRGKMFF